MDVDAMPLCSPSLLADSANLPLSCPEDLLQHTLLHDETPYEGRPKWASWLDAAGLGGNVAAHNLYFNSVSLALAAAIEGQGVVLTLEQLAQDDVGKGRLVPLFDLPLNIDHAYHMVSLASSENDPRVTAFKSWLLSEVA